MSGLIGMLTPSVYVFKPMVLPVVQVSYQPLANLICGVQNAQLIIVCILCTWLLTSFSTSTSVNVGHCQDPCWKLNRDEQLPELRC